MKSNIKISIICPCYNERAFIGACIDSIAHQDCGVTNIELLVVDGMSQDGTRDIVTEKAKQYSWLRLVDNPRKIAPVAMNIGINQARGKYIVRVDAHSIYPSNYVSSLVYALDNLAGAQNVGAICRTLPADDSLMARANAITASHPFGVGNSSFRIGADRIKEVDTVPFGCWRKEWLQQIGGFDEELVRNQDDELNARTIEHGGKIYLLPTIIVDYYARRTLAQAWKMFYQYGLYKPLVNQKLQRPATLRQFVPPLFVLGLFPALPLYLLIVGGISIRYRNIALMLSFPAIHLSYGLGYWVGLIHILLHKKMNVNSNH